MLSRIKASYFILKVFSFLEEKNLLEIIKYNKNLQGALDRNIINYKIFSGKYMIYEDESNKKRRIYDAYNDALIFEGEFLNGRKNGKVKEFDDFLKLEFKKGFLYRSKWNGKWKELYFEGRLTFEGKYLNGKKVKGKSKEYNLDGELVYEIDYINGKVWEFKQYNNNNNIINELHEGKGIIKEYNYLGKIISQYEYLNGEKNGHKKILL